MPMMRNRDDLAAAVQTAVRQFWLTRSRQAEVQGARSGVRDQGARRAVTGGAHLDGFAELIRDLIVEAGVSDTAVHRGTRVELPGYYRAEKKWDLVVVVDGRLFATVEFKAQVGPSFGNNYNNRTEEALGNATDYWAAFREGAFRGSPRPWLGYLMLLEDATHSTRPVSVAEPHFPVFDEFRGASYAKRYEILLTKMVRERLYDAASLILSPRDSGQEGTYSEPCEELAFANFAESLIARAIAYSRTRS
ncbi:MAG TPA: PaeR7I family type II restriction endonuclease [Candidatus Fermentibacter daniensis]|nr:MAG: Type-2 restriction enzyme PaeR7I [Bacteroidetes bacterium ADurb.BinA012]HPH40651.1 PaeR7I family type II restriction endonuclease [Candidatus Fermentibacter daniensis]